MSIKEVSFAQYLPQMIEQLPQGAFLTSAPEGRLNTMTIGWGNVGIIWSIPVFSVAVRYSRHTYSLLEDSDQFTVSVPLGQDMRDALMFCGTKSGRDYDKFKECNLIVQPGQVLKTPVIGQCKLHYECSIVYKQAMEPGLLQSELRNRFYSDNHDYHVLYYGKIVAAYVNLE